MEDTADVFKESLDKMEAMDLEANLEAMEAVGVLQEVCNEEMNVDIIGTLEDRYGDQFLVVGCR
jgi:hypothetical protein